MTSLIRRAIHRAADPFQRVGNVAARPFGFQLMKISHRTLGDPSSVDLLASHLRELFAMLAVDCVVDVGANQGQYYDFLRDKVRFQGRILSFEPIPALARALKERSVADAKWTVFDCALGARDDVLPLKIANRSGWSSLLEKAEAPDTDFADGVRVAEIVNVPVRTLDGVFDSIGLSAKRERVYLKIDAQGFDLDVLRGAVGNLTAICALQTELELLPVYAAAPTFQTVLEFLLAGNYRITGVFPVWRDSTLRIGELDTVFRNMEVANAPAATRGV